MLSCYQIYVVEEDSRTHLENDFYRDAMGLYDIQDSIDHLIVAENAERLKESEL